MFKYKTAYFCANAKLSTQVATPVVNGCLTLGLLGAYLWRTFDAARRRPPYLIERADGEKPLDRRARG